MLDQTNPASRPCDSRSTPESPQRIQTDPPHSAHKTQEAVLPVLNSPRKDSSAPLTNTAPPTNEIQKTEAIAQSTLNVARQPSPPPLPQPSENQFVFELIEKWLELEQGFQTPLLQLAKKLAETHSSPEDFLRDCAKYKQELYKTISTVDLREDYLNAYRLIAKKFPGCSLLPPITLTNGEECRRIDRFLLTSLSPVVQTAFAQQMQESANNTFSCPELENAAFEYFAAFIENGYVENWSGSIQVVFDAYSAAHKLDIPDLLNFCKIELYRYINKEDSDLEDLNAVWNCGILASDPFLKGCCVQWMQTHPTGSQVPEPLQALCREFLEVKELSGLEIHPRNKAFAQIQFLDERILHLLQQIGIEGIGFAGDLQSLTNKTNLLKQLKVLEFVNYTPHVSLPPEFLVALLDNSNSRLTYLNCNCLGGLQYTPAVHEAIEKNNRITSLNLKAEILVNREALISALLKNTTLRHLTLWSSKEEDRKSLDEALKTRPARLIVCTSDIREDHTFSLCSTTGESIKATEGAFMDSLVLQDIFLKDLLIQKHDTIYFCKGVDKKTLQHISEYLTTIKGSLDKQSPLHEIINFYRAAHQLKWDSLLKVSRKLIKEILENHPTLEAQTRLQVLGEECHDIEITQMFRNQP